jgi:K+-transporting ATPase KdpF subunit
LNVDWTMILAFVVAVLLAIYLAAALFLPEKFS